MITSVLDSTVNFTEPWITWKQSLNWVIVSTMLVCGHVCEKLSWLLIGRGGPSPLLVVLFIGQEVLSCIQKLAEHEPREISKQHSSMVLPWVPDLISISDGLSTGSAGQLSPPTLHWEWCLSQEQKRNQNS